MLFSKAVLAATLVALVSASPVPGKDKFGNTIPSDDEAPQDVRAPQPGPPTLTRESTLWAELTSGVVTISVIEDQSGEFSYAVAAKSGIQGDSFQGSTSWDGYSSIDYLPIATDEDPEPSRMSAYIYAGGPRDGFKNNYPVTFHGGSFIKELGSFPNSSNTFGDKQYHFTRFTGSGIHQKSIVTHGNGDTFALCSGTINGQKYRVLHFFKPGADLLQGCEAIQELFFSPTGIAAGH